MRSTQSVVALNWRYGASEKILKHTAYLPFCLVFGGLQISDSEIEVGKWGGGQAAALSASAGYILAHFSDPHPSPPPHPPPHPLVGIVQR